MGMKQQLTAEEVASHVVRRVTLIFFLCFRFRIGKYIYVCVLHKINQYKDSKICSKPVFYGGGNLYRWVHCYLESSLQGRLQCPKSHLR